MTGLQHAAAAYVLCALALGGYALWVWRGHRAAARRQRTRSRP